jgi:catechol 2,3-dioxygenase-like lactoylglutathione lyase family enzyme
MLPDLSRALGALTVLAISSLAGRDRGARFELERVPTTAEAPAPSHLEAVAFDAARRRLVLFGGSRQGTDNKWADLNETWEWDGTRWHAIATVAGEPGARRAHALAYDPGERRVVLVGGVRSRPDGKGDDAFDDTWTFDGRRWERGPAAPVMSGHALVYSSADRTMLLLGYLGREQYEPRRLVVWRRAPNGWAFADSTGPELTGLVRAAYDTRRSVLVVPVLHGSTPRVWEWDGRRWRDIGAPGPAPRSRHVVAYDSRSGHVVLMGGRENSTRNTLGDVWGWDGQRWTSLSYGTGAPEPRASAWLVADADSGRLLLYGGAVPQRGLVADLWIGSGSSWTQWTPTGNAGQQPTAPPFTSVRGAFIGISVADMEASVRWYREKLGLEVIMRPPKVEKSTAVILAGGGLTVELMHHDDAVPLSQAAPAITRNFLVHGIFKAGIVVVDFDKTIAALRARGVPIAIGPFPASAQQPANAIIRDNAGNYIQFFGER